mgnify:CR=1 FL=1
MKTNLHEILLFEKKAEIFKALSNTVRLEIIDILLDGEKCVNEIVEKLSYEQPHISKSLAKLRSSGIIKDQKRGLKVYYSISKQYIADFIKFLNKSLL